MAVDELNPNHPITRAAHDQWHKLLALAMFVTNHTEVHIREVDITNFLRKYNAVVLDTTDEKAKGHIVLKLVTLAEAEKLARKAGGLPT